MLSTALLLLLVFMMGVAATMVLTSKRGPHRRSNGAGSASELKLPTERENRLQRSRDAAILEHFDKFNALGHIEEDDKSVDPFVPMIFERGSPEDTTRWSRAWYDVIRRRRSPRDFSSAAVPLSTLEFVLRSGGSAPSGANCQPWSFCLISNADIKAKLRDLIETEEKINYEKRMGVKWVSDLHALGTNWQKPYLTEAPYVLVVFRCSSGIDDRTGEKVDHYYPEISTGIAVGFLITAIHQAGLATVVTTPMNAGGAIRELLERPTREKVYVLLPIGFPADNAKVPNLTKKPLHSVMHHYG